MFKWLPFYCVVIIFLMSCTAIAEENREQDYHSSSITISKENTRACEKLDFNSNCINLRWGGDFTILKKSEDKQWFQIEVLYTGNFWVNRKDVALFEDFKPYNAELPIDSIEYLDLTTIVDFKFLPDGNVKVIDEEGEWKGKVFYAPDLLEVRYFSDFNNSFYFGFKDGKVKLIHCVEGKDVPCKVTYKKGE